MIIKIGEGFICRFRQDYWKHSASFPFRCAHTQLSLLCFLISFSTDISLFCLLSSSSTIIHYTHSQHKGAPTLNWFIIFFNFIPQRIFFGFLFWLHCVSKLYCAYCSLCCVVLNRKLCRSKTIFVCCCFCVLCSIILFCHWVKTVKPYCIHWKASVTVRVYMTNGTECRLCVAVNTQQK